MQVSEQAKAASLPALPSKTLHEVDARGPSLYFVGVLNMHALSSVARHQLTEQNATNQIERTPA
jgi:hypothetical protein